MVYAEMAAESWVIKEEEVGKVIFRMVLLMYTDSPSEFGKGGIVGAVGVLEDREERA